MARRALVLTFSLLVLLSLFAAPPALADPGDLDPNWSADGRARTTFGDLEDGAHSLAIQADQKVVVVGSTNDFEGTYADFFSEPFGVRPAGDPCTDWAIARYREDGVLDTTFGPAGNGKIRIGSSFCDEARDVVIDGDQNIVVVGDLNEGPAVARYLPDGTLDPTFVPGGLPPGLGGLSFPGEAHAVVIDTAGNIVVTGVRFSDPDRLFVARFEPDGDLDPTFNAAGTTPGVFEYTDDGDHTFGNDLVLQPDGKIVVVGGAVPDCCGGRWLVLRLTTAGVLDGTFNPGGSPPGTRTFFNVSDGRSEATAVAMQGNKPVVTGFEQEFNPCLTQGICDSSFVSPVIRLVPNSNLDPAFGNGGVKFIDAGSGSEGMADVQVQRDRKIVLVGTDEVFTEEGAEGADMLVVRLTKDTGAYDSTFHADGRVHVDFGQFESAEAVAIKLDGNLLVAGHTEPEIPDEELRTQGSPNEIQGDIAVARLYGDPKGLDCTVSGTPGNDVLSGSAGPDVICGGAGNDTLKGFKGNDILRGGQGNDTIEGGLGADYLLGYAGNDKLNAADGAGGDVLEGDSGTDTCTTDAGDIVINC